MISLKNRSFYYDQIFTPAAPIKERRYLFGRDTELSALTRAINRPGIHPVVVGSRGVGKTSLVLCGTNALKKPIIKLGCNSDTTSKKLFYQILNSAGCDMAKIESSTEKSKNIKAKGSPFNIGLETQGSEKKIYKCREIGSEDLDPWSAFSALRELNSKFIIVLDEYDAIPSSSEEFHISMASFIKHLSDHSHECDIKLVIVGVAKSVRELLVRHESIERNVFAINVNRLDFMDMYRFLSEAENRLNFLFDESVKKQISLRSMGYPFYVHLLGLECLDVMIDRDENARIVTEKDYQLAIDKTLNSIFQSELIKYRKTISTLSKIEKNIIEELSEKSLAKKNELQELFEIKMKIAEMDFYKALENLENKEILYIDKNDDVIQFFDPLLAPFLCNWINRGKVDDTIFDILEKGI